MAEPAPRSHGAPFLLAGTMLVMSAVISWRATAGAQEAVVAAG